MIPIALAAEPATFNKRVRQRGLAAIAELVGKKPQQARSGRRREKIANRERDIPPSVFPPFWRDALDDMLVAYERRCSFLALYIEHATGNPSVDHLLPKSRAWKQVYEWSNYRLCAALINGAKRDLVGLVDPFACGPHWFALELVGFQVIRGPGAPASRGREIDATLRLLNHDECRKAREVYVQEYERGAVTLDFLERRAPFIASELRRQRKLRHRDQ
jgi:hypothetical protein